MPRAGEECLRFAVELIRIELFQCACSSVKPKIRRVAVVPDSPLLNYFFRECQLVQAGRHFLPANEINELVRLHGCENPAL